MENQTIDKKAIGAPDMHKAEKIVDCIRKLCNHSTLLKYDLDVIYADGVSVPLEDFFEIVKSQNPLATLTQRYVEKRGISIPGISMQKMIDNNLIDMPEIDVNYITENISIVLKYLDVLREERYAISLSEIYDLENGRFGNDEFFQSLENKVIEYLTVFTQSADENMLLEKVQKLADAINDFVELGILPKDGRCLRIESFLGPIYGIDRTFDRPVKISPNLFKVDRLRRFSTEKKFQPQPDFDINKILS